MLDHDKVKLDHQEVRPLLVPEKTAAQLIGVSYGMLVAGRFRKQPLLPFVRIGTRTIRYQVSDIKAYISSRVVVTDAPFQPAASAHPNT